MMMMMMLMITDDILQVVLVQELTVVICVAHRRCREQPPRRQPARHRSSRPHRASRMFRLYQYSRPTTISRYRRSCRRRRSASRPMRWTCHSDEDVVRRALWACLACYRRRPCRCSTASPAASTSRGSPAHQPHRPSRPPRRPTTTMRDPVHCHGRRPDAVSRPTGTRQLGTDCWAGGTATTTAEEQPFDGGRSTTRRRTPTQTTGDGTTAPPENVSCRTSTVYRVMPSRAASCQCPPHVRDVSQGQGHVYLGQGQCRIPTPTTTKSGADTVQRTRLYRVVQKVDYMKKFVTRVYALRWQTFKMVQSVLGHPVRFISDEL